jgi:hypothetical protein
VAAFWRSGDRVCAVVEEDEAQLVRRLVTDVQAMLTDTQPSLGGLDPVTADWFGAGPVAPPEDPAMARLLPDGYRDDPDAAAELRRLTESSLRQTKSETAQRLLDSLPEDGGSLTLDLSTAEAWLGALNDVRLVLGTRLNVTDDDADSQEWALRGGDDPMSVAFRVYRWLSLVQDELVTAVWD